MPRKRRVTKLRARRLIWDDVSISTRLDFWTGWRPPVREQEHNRGPWLTWEEFFDDWLQVREDALTEWEAHRAEMLTHAQAAVADRAAKLKEAEGEGECWVDLATVLYENAVEHLAEREAQELPFAEIQYQRALQGLPLGYEEEAALSAEDEA